MTAPVEMVDEYMRSERGRGAVRDSVKNVWELALGFGVPGGEDSLEFLGNQAAVVDLYGGPGDALGRYGVSQGGESEFVGEEGVAPISKEPETLRDTVTVSEGKSDHVVPRGMEDVDEFGQRFEGG